MGALLTAISVMPQAPATRPAKPSRSQAEHSRAATASTAKRKIPCKTPENASLCYWTHGRLSFWGTYAPWRIWRVGTQRLLRICNGPSHFPPHDNHDCTEPQFPVNLDSIYDDPRRWELEPEMAFPRETEYFPPDVFADFEICPLEPEKKGKMQAVCIESARKIFVEK
jgi:hypothetical protein